MEENEVQKKKKRRHWEWVPFLLAMLLSFVCVFIATAAALMTQPDKLNDASMLPVGTANYGELNSEKERFGQLNEAIFADATQDSAGLRLTPDGSGETSGNRKTPVFIAFVTPAPTQTSVPPPVIVTMDMPRTAVPSPLPTLTTQPISTPTASSTSTRAVTVTPSQTPWPLPTYTNTPWPTVTWTNTPMPPQPPTNTPRPPDPATNTPRPPATTTATATNIATATATATHTATAIPTDTATATATATSTATAAPTATVPAACSGSVPSGEPNWGLPNGTLAIIPCGQNITVDLGANAIVVTGAEPAFDFIFYEYENPASHIRLDWIIIEASVNGVDGWTQIYNWGNDIVDLNSNIGQLGYGASGEPDNHEVPLTDLYGGDSTGVAIDLDAVVPPGTYQWIRISSPLGGENDGPTVDSIEVIP